MASGDRRANYLISVGLLMIFVAIVLVYGPIPTIGSLFLYPKDLTHWVGWLAALTLIASTILTLNFKGRLAKDLHCILGGASLLAALYHVNARLNPFTGTPIGFWIIRPIDYSSLIVLALMAVIVASGVLRRYLPNNRYVKAYGRAFHLPLTAAFAVMLTYHVLQKTGII
jgi:hypothetical protein